MYEFYVYKFAGIHYIRKRIGSLPISSGVIKRESGANPEQSRCCESPATSRQHLLPLIFIGKAAEIRSKSEDLPFIKGCCYSWDRAQCEIFINTQCSKSNDSDSS